jgi:hypothetical protein
MKCNPFKVMWRDIKEIIPIALGSLFISILIFIQLLVIAVFLGTLGDDSLSWWAKLCISVIQSEIFMAIMYAIYYWYKNAKDRC